MPLMPVDEAKALILAGAKPLSVEIVPLAAAHLRILARDQKARRDQPPFPASAMDGYAVHSSDTEVSGRRLKVIGASAAGHAFRGPLARGEAVRIFTGAPVPLGADAVLVQENACLEGISITAAAAVAPGQHVRPRGLDFKKGERLLAAGKRLTARDIAVAASMNLALLPVRRKPAVAILATGDELVEPGGRPRADQITASNSHALAAFVHCAGGDPRIMGIAKDDGDEIRAAIRRARQADIFMITGGASVGEHDLVRSALQSEGISITFWKVAMRPGKPLMFARRRGQRIIGLPGNPVSALVCARVFIKPLIDRMLGATATELPVVASLVSPMRANDERQEYARGRLERRKDGSLWALPYPVQDSSMLRTLAEAECLIVRPPHAVAAAPGDRVEILPIDF
jgi:molybdopterin molybdotransferase